MLLANAAALAGRRCPLPVVLAGNADARGEAEALLRSGGVDVQATANVLPRDRPPRPAPRAGGDPRGVPAARDRRQAPVGRPGLRPGGPLRHARTPCWPASSCSPTARATSPASARCSWWTWAGRPPTCTPSSSPTPRRPPCTARSWSRCGASARWRATWASDGARRGSSRPRSPSGCCSPARPARWPRPRDAGRPSPTGCPRPMTRPAATSTGGWASWPRSPRCAATGGPAWTATCGARRRTCRAYGSWWRPAGCSGTCPRPSRPACSRRCSTTPAAAGGRRIGRARWSTAGTSWRPPGCWPRSRPRPRPACWPSSSSAATP